MTKKLYYGDNLLFKTPKGQETDAQITAFEDTWHWGGQAQDEFREIEKCKNTEVTNGNYVVLYSHRQCRLGHRVPVMKCSRS